MNNQKPKIGVMGSASNENISEEKRIYLDLLAQQLGKTIAAQNCVLITGETSGLPGRVIETARAAGALTVGISPANNAQEQRELYNYPPLSSDVIIYTGFGHKGRNVINIRSSDIVIIFSGSMGTLNEFTIAYDEGKIIGVLEGTGGIADQIRIIVEALAKKTKAKLVYEKDPGMLIEACLKLFRA